MKEIVYKVGINYMKNSEKLTLMDPKFSKIRLKLLSNVCFNYVDPSIAIGYGTSAVVCLNVQSWV